MLRARLVTIVESKECWRAAERRAKLGQRVYDEKVARCRFAHAFFSILFKITVARARARALRAAVKFKGTFFFKIAFLFALFAPLR